VIVPVYSLFTLPMGITSMHRPALRLLIALILKLTGLRERDYPGGSEE